ncbi:MAG TPA: ABC transporter permease [Terracidiphilus sp.]|nr:ABC transporter permease [Terracidiphilus sp.]
MHLLSRLFGRRRRYNDLAVSIHEHIAERADELEEQGMPRAQAEQQARREFGNVALIQQRSREAWQWQTIESVWADAKFALRQLLKSPGITLVVVLTLAVGIGAATAVFSVAYGVLIDPFPYKDVHALATPNLCSPQVSHCYWDNYTPEQFLEIAQETDIFSGVTASTAGNVTLTGSEEAQQVRGSYVTPNIFEVLGVQPILGRPVAEDDVHPGREEVALISYRYWQAHFGGSTSVLGRVIKADGDPRTIIGVMPRHFLWRRADVYLPIQMTPTEQIEGHSRFTLVGRVKPEVTEAHAAAELRPIFQDFAQKDPHRYPQNLRLGLMRFDQMFRSGLTSTLHLLLGAVFVLLLIACVNVSSLLLARAVKREHEFVVRAAMGASRMRLVRQVMAESLLLSVVAMPVALALAYAGLQLMLSIVPVDTIPDEAVVTLNLPVMLVSIAIALFTALVFGLSPAWHSASPRLAAIFTSIWATGSRMQRHLLHGFVVAEIAMSLVLLTLAGLMMRSMIAVAGAPVSFQPDHTLMMRVPLDPKRYPEPEDRIRFFNRLLDQVSHLPGVKAATVDTELPFLWGYGVRIKIGSQTVHQSDYSNLHLVTPAYLDISSQHMLQGHFVDAREVSEQAHDVVVTEDFARRYFPDGNALGQAVHLVDFTPLGKNLADNAFTIVGIMANLPEYPGHQQDYPHIFLPFTVAPVMDTVVISTSLPADSLIQPVRRVIHSFDSDQPITDAASLRELLDMYGYAGPRFALALFGAFAIAALVLSLIGIYGVFSFVTSQRTREIGIRMALGANHTNVMRMVLRQACALALLGIAAGLPLAFLAGRFAKSELFHTRPHDPVTFFAVVCILPLLSIAGTWLPALRAASVDPMQAIRSE